MIASHDESLKERASVRHDLVAQCRAKVASGAYGDSAVDGALSGLAVDLGMTPPPTPGWAAFATEMLKEFE